MSKKVLPAADLKDMAVSILDDMKAQDVSVLDVSQLTDVTDYMVIASGSSNRHVRSMAGELRDRLREREGLRPLGVEGEEQGEWVLIDLGDVVVHIMRPQTREYYDLERLWSKEVEELLRLNRDNKIPE